MAVSQIRLFVPGAFTRYPIGTDESNTLISPIKISCEMPKGGYNFLDAALSAVPDASRDKINFVSVQ